MEEKNFEVIKSAKELLEFCDIHDSCEECIFFNTSFDAWNNKCMIGYPNEEWNKELETLNERIFDDRK